MRQVDAPTARRCWYSQDRSAVRCLQRASATSERDAAMLLMLDHEIKAAYQNAADAAEWAKTCLLPEERDGWLTLESGYLLLARSLEISRGVNRWVAEVHRRLKGQAH
jgi:hypothetical protein